MNRSINRTNKDSIYTIKNNDQHVGDFLNKTFNQLICASINTNYNDYYDKENQNNKLSSYKYILIVDDVSLCRKSLKSTLDKILKKMNYDKKYKVLKAADGLDTINIMTNKSFENIGNNVKLIISDENMLIINGSKSFELINKTLINNQKNKIATIIYTALESESAIDNILKESNCNEVIKKPGGKVIFENLLYDL